MSFLRWRGRSSSAQQAQHDEVVVRLDRQHRRISAVEQETMRIGTQVAALESRVDMLSHRLHRAPTEQEGDAETGRAVLEEIRAEHARVRARVSAAIRHEERLRLLEEKVLRLEGADVPEGQR